MHFLDMINILILSIVCIQVNNGMTFLEKEHIVMKKRSENISFSCIWW